MKRIVVYVLAVVFLLSLSGCGGAQKMEKELGSQPAAEQIIVADQSNIPVSRKGGEADNGLKRKVTRDVSLVISVHDVKEADTRIQQFLGEASGYIQESGVWQEKGRMQGTMILRVPDGKLEKFISDLETLGKVERKNIVGKDVTEEYYDAAAHKTTLEKQEKRLLDLLSKAGSVKDMLEIENELARVRGQIESLQGRLKVMDNLTDYATVNIELKDSKKIYTDGTLKEPFVSRIKTAWLMGADGAVNLVEGFVVLLVILLPYIPVVALVGYVTYRIWKRRRSGSRD